MYINNDLMGHIENSIRSLFDMIVIVDDVTAECTIIDHNRELNNISVKPNKVKNTISLNELQKELIKNVHPSDRESVSMFTDHEYYVEKLKDNVQIAMECRIRHANRRYYWSEMIICNTTTEDSTEGNDCILLIRDINDRKKGELKREAEERAVFKSLQAQYDKLFEENMTDQQTGCYNRKGLNFYSDIVIDDARKNSKNLFVCVADLNGLKHLNDTYGHAAGDEAIRVVSSELIKASPSDGKAVRIGGDEFLIFAALDEDSPEPGDFAEKLDKGIEAYNRSHDNPYTVGVSYGWVLLPVKENMTSLDDYIEKADAKMYEMRTMRDKYRRDRAE